VDKLSSEQRSRNMAAVRSRDTRPEKRVRSILHSMGFRFRIHKASLPGTRILCSNATPRSYWFTDVSGMDMVAQEGKRRRRVEISGFQS